MALIKCPECGGLVSDRAKKCPHCGCPMEKIILLQEQKPIPDGDVKIIPDDSLIANEELVSQEKEVEQNLKEEEQQQEEVKPVETNNEKESVIDSPIVESTNSDKAQLKKLGIISVIAAVVLLSCYFIFGHKGNTENPVGAESAVNIESTESNNWMDGYWVSESRYECLFVSNGKIYCYSPQDEVFVVEPSDIKPWGIFEIGNILHTRQDWNTGDEIIDSRTTIGIQNFNAISNALNLSEFQLKESKAQLMRAATSFTSKDFSFVASIEQEYNTRIVFSNEDEKRLFIIVFDMGDNLGGFNTFSRVEPTR